MQGVVSLAVVTAGTAAHSLHLILVGFLNCWDGLSTFYGSFFSQRLSCYSSSLLNADDVTVCAVSDFSLPLSLLT